jgi:hypothetical protein
MESCLLGLEQSPEQGDAYQPGQVGGEQTLDICDVVFMGQLELWGESGGRSGEAEGDWNMRPCPPGQGVEPEGGETEAGEPEAGETEEAIIK